MGRMRHYKPLLVEVEPKEERRATWGIGREKIVGTEHVYEVTDGNFGRLNRWEFIVQVPRNGGDLIVRPAQVPGKKIWANEDRRSLKFIKARRRGYQRYRYCKVNVADASGDQNRISLERGIRSQLPNWFKYFLPIMRLKDTVTLTRANDGDHQVLVISPDDHERMIRAYFALRVWMLEEGVTVE